MRWLHITVLELLATGFSTMIFSAQLPPQLRLTLGADASATVTTFTKETETSEMLVHAHHLFLNSTEFKTASARVDLGHLRGDSNIASDLVSRGLWKQFYRLCHDLRIRPVQLEVPKPCLRILNDVLAHARARNIPVKPNPYQSQPPIIPPELRQYAAPAARKRSHSEMLDSDVDPALPSELFGLGRCPSCVDYDGPTNREALSNALEQVALGAESESLGTALNTLAMTFGFQPRSSMRRTLLAVLSQALWPHNYPTDNTAFEHFNSSRASFIYWKKLLSSCLPLSSLAQECLQSRAHPGSSSSVDESSDPNLSASVPGPSASVPAATSSSAASLPAMSELESPTELAAVQEYLSHRSWAERSSAFSLVRPVQHRCLVCAVQLPLELFGRGRCPSCVDYDGPGRLATAWRKAVPTLDPCSEPLPKRSRMQLAREQAGMARLPTPTPPTPPAAQPAMSTRMPTLTVGGQRFAAPAGRKERATSARKQAMLNFARRRAAEMAAPNASAEQVAMLEEAVVATHELAEHGAAVGTLDKDDHAWVYWDRFCTVYGWDPLISPEFARTQPHEVSQRLAIFQAWVYPQLRGRNQPDAKPQTVFNSYVLSVVRTLAREHVPMPKAKAIERNLAGLMRTFKLIYGVEALMPGRKQPFTPAMWARIEGLADGHALAGRAPWSPRTSLRDRTLLRLGRVLWRTGHRMGEVVWHPSGEINYLTRASVSISKASGAKIATPTAANWHALQPGDSVLLAPCVSKSDQFGQQHCPFPSVLPYDGTNQCAAGAVRDIELESPCVASQRSTTPLFADAHGKPFTYAVLHAALRALLTALFGARFASAYSWHSIRIGLACALHAADCPDAVIQLICRWSSPDSLKVYRQMGIEKNVFWTTRAFATTFDATRVNNLPVLDIDDALLLQCEVFESSPGPSTPRPPAATTPAARPVQTFTIPGGHVQAHPSDTEGLIGLQVRVPSSFWSDGDRTGDAFHTCVVAAECAREFRHPDGTRARTYLLSENSQYFPIKRTALLQACLTRAQLSSLHT